MNMVDELNFYFNFYKLHIIRALRAKNEPCSFILSRINQGG